MGTLNDILVDIKNLADNLDNKDKSTLDALEAIVAVSKHKKIIDTGSSVQTLIDSVRKDRVNPDIVAKHAVAIRLDMYCFEMAGTIIDSTVSLLKTIDEKLIKWIESDEKRKSNRASYLGIVGIRLEKIAGLQSAFRIAALTSSYRPVWEWKGFVQAVQGLSWFTATDKQGFKPGLTWEKVYAFLTGYNTNSSVKVHSEGILIKPDRVNSNPFLDDLRNSGFLQPGEQLYQDWMNLIDDLYRFKDDVIALKANS